MTEIDLDRLTPQLQRIIRLAIIESERTNSTQASRADTDSLMVAALQDDNNLLSELLHACNLSINDLRRGDMTPKLLPQTPAA